jgi:hypothetical protein
LIVSATIVIPFIFLGELFGFGLPLYLPIIGIIVLLYIIAAEIVKGIFYKRVKL